MNCISIAVGKMFETFHLLVGGSSVLILLEGELQIKALVNIITLLTVLREA